MLMGMNRSVYKKHYSGECRKSDKSSNWVYAQPFDAIEDAQGWLNKQPFELARVTVCVTFEIYVTTGQDISDVIEDFEDG